MKIKTIRLKKNNDLVPEKEREVKGMIIMLALFGAGMIIGAGLLRNGSSEFTSDFLTMFDTYTEMRTTQKIYITFFNSLAVNIAFILISFVVGFSCIGLPVSGILPILKGLGSGVVSGYLFSHFAMSGIGYYFLTIFPGAIIGNSAMLLACNCSSFMSIDILSIITGKKQADELLIHDYIKKYLIIFALSAVSSIIDAILTKSFSYLFTL